MNKQSAEEPHGRPFSLVGTVVASVTMLRYIYLDAKAGTTPIRSSTERHGAGSRGTSSLRTASVTARRTLPAPRTLVERGYSRGAAGHSPTFRPAPAISSTGRLAAPGPSRARFRELLPGGMYGTPSISVRVSSSSRRPVDNDDDVVVPRAGGTTVAREIPRRLCTCSFVREGGGRTPCPPPAPPRAAAAVSILPSIPSPAGIPPLWCMVWYGTPSISARIISAGAPGFASRGRENDVSERERGDDGREGEEEDGVCRGPGGGGASER